jgi:glyoxylase-like metal-dependent hydrolase (beta-lactamase superfamily II)
MPAKAGEKFTVEQVSNAGWDSRIAVFRCAPVVDAFVVVTERYVVIVDTLVSPAAARQMLDYARLHLRSGRQLLVVNTHADWDHTWGNQLFAGPGADLPALLIGNQRSRPLFDTPEAANFLQEMQRKNPGLFADLVLTPPSLLFDRKLVIDGGDLALEIFLAEGHTADHCAVYLPQIRTLLAADAAEVPYPAARESRLFPAMLRTLQLLADLNAEVVLYCHAPGRIDGTLLFDNLVYFSAVEACCREALARGLPDDLPPDEDLPALVRCRFEQTIPAGLNTPELHDYYRTAGHGMQIRMTLEMLRRENGSFAG